MTRTATCTECSREFTFTSRTKPPLTCSLACHYQRRKRREATR